MADEIETGQKGKVSPYAATEMDKEYFDKYLKIGRVEVNKILKNKK